MEDTIAKQKAEIDELRRKLEHMNEVFANAQRVRFGQSSEKNSYVLHDQASFFNEAEKEQAPKAEEPTPDTILVPQHERKKKRSQAEMLNGLPEEEVLLELPEDQLVCGKCGGKMKPIGKKFLRHEMQIIPKQIKLLAYYAVTYACDSCEKDTGFAHIVTVKPPVPLMKHSLASPSTVAYIMTQKYVDVPELTPTIVNEYIKKIEVFAPDKSSGKRVQKVKIYFNFVDDVEIPVISEPVVAKSTLGRRKTA